MACKKEHLNFGLFTAVVLVIIYIFAEKPRNLVEIILNGLIILCSGVIGSLLPDILEPAYNPFHRKSFHSLMIGGFEVFGIKELPKKKLEPAIKYGSMALLIGYLSHLLLDGFTPRKLPLI